MRHPDSPIRAIEHWQARSGTFENFPVSIDSRLREAFDRRGLAQLYTHQAEACRLAGPARTWWWLRQPRAEKLSATTCRRCNGCWRDPHARALYLFPTKALAEDQLHEFQSWSTRWVPTFACSPTTATRRRTRARRFASARTWSSPIPDMLHCGRSAASHQWAKAFENLRYIVIDELHYYRGVYGSHLANLLRRLKRICEFYGSKPQFICCSATIANPKELAEALTGRRSIWSTATARPAAKNTSSFTIRRS